MPGQAVPPTLKDAAGSRQSRAAASQPYGGAGASPAGSIPPRAPGGQGGQEHSLFGGREARRGGDVRAAVPSDIQEVLLRCQK